MVWLLDDPVVAWLLLDGLLDEAVVGRVLDGLLGVPVFLVADELLTD